MTLDAKEQKQMEQVLGKLDGIDKRVEADYRQLKIKTFKEKLQLFKERDALLEKIPNFWLACMLNSSIQVHCNDEDTNVLQYLTKLSVEVTPQHEKVTLHFSANDFIENSTLSKTLKYDDEKATFDKVKWKKSPKRSKTEAEGTFFKAYCGDETEMVQTLSDIYETPIEYYEADNETEDTKSNQTLSEE